MGRRWRRAAAVDLLAVVLFVVIGRASHHHGEEVGGIASTAWPFAVGAGAGWLWLAGRARRQDRRGGTRPAAGLRSPGTPASVTSGVAVCVSTVAAGMVLRVVAGQGTAPAFVVVATGFLGFVMVGGRVALDVVGRRLGRSAPAPERTLR